MQKLSKEKGFSNRNVKEVPKQSGIYVLKNANDNVQYVGSAGAGRLQNRLLEHLNQQDIPNSTSFQFRKTSSLQEALALEKEYIKRLKPKHNKQLNNK